MNRLDFLLQNQYNPLKCGIFIARSIVDLLNNMEPFITTFDGNIFDYYRDDIAQMMMPSICVNVEDTKSYAKYYYLYYPIKIDVFLPLEISHFSEATARANIMALLDTFFKRPDVQNYLSKCNYGLMDIAGLKSLVQVSNINQLDGKRSARILSFQCVARIDRIVYNEILINRFGVSPSNLILQYDFPYLQGIKTVLVEPETYVPLNLGAE